MMADTVLPYTGKEFLDSLDDGREVWIYGERVKNIAAHPAFRNTARMIARLYDALHTDHAEGKNILTCPTEWGGFTHRYFTAPRSAEELVAGRDAIADWARITYGWLGRSPDYKAAFLATLGANADFYEPYQENARRWYRYSQERVPYVNHAIVHPPVDRNMAPGAPGGPTDIYAHVTKETDAGIYVTGAKVVATGSALTHFTFVAHVGLLPIQDKNYALVFLVPTNAKGVKFICRVSNEQRAAVLGSPFDYPLSSRLDENDAIFIMDDVFVPWEDVFVYGDIDKANTFFPRSGFVPRFQLHGCTRLAVKLDFITGLLIKATETAGTSGFRGVEANIGEVITWRHCMWALTDAMARNPDPWAGGYVLPNHNAGSAYHVLAPDAYVQIKHQIEKTVASSLIYLNSSARDFAAPEIRKYLDLYVRGSGGVTAVERVKLMKLLWDSIGTEFGARHELYEVNYSGSHEEIRRFAILGAKRLGSGCPVEGVRRKLYGRIRSGRLDGARFDQPRRCQRGAAETDMTMILNLNAEFAKLTMLKNRTPTSSEAERKGAFARVAPYRDGAIFTAKFAGKSAWERHPQGEEIVQIVEGATALHLMTDEGKQSLSLTAGMMAIVPTNTWHQFETSGVALMTATPQPTQHVRVDVEDPRTAG
jgi:aromatic ring hydroxylase/quercetin dioxygenase-like cupin family protein